MALALYRKYRPQKFSDITGQHHVKTTLAREIASDKMAHAYIFSGTRGTGKTSTARIFAKAINCLKRKSGTGEPCDSCELCNLIRQGRALDVIEIDAASHTGVDNVREVIVETAKYAPSQAAFKVFIIDEVHMLSTSAWNALLKIMEEPPAHVVFILATTEVHKVPATILSRCQRFDFHRVENNELIILLRNIAEKEKVKVEDDVLAAVGRISEGCVRDAQGLLEQLLALGEKTVDAKVAELVLPRGSSKDVLTFIENIATQQVKSGLLLIGKLRDEGVDLEQFNLEFLEVVRAIILFKVIAQKELLNAYEASAQEALHELAKLFEIPRLLVVVEAFSKAGLALKIARIPTLPLEVAFLEVCGPEKKYDTNSPSQSEQNAPVFTAASKSIPETRPRFSEAVTSHNNVNSAEPSTQTAAMDSKPEINAKIISIDEIKSKWAELLKMVQTENHSLTFLLTTGEPVAVFGNKVHIGVQYPFHCDKLNEPKCRAILENILRTLLNSEVRVEAVVRAKNIATPDAMEDVLRTLGGKVVD